MGIEDKLILTESVIRRHLRDTLYWLKPAGEDCCEARLRDPETYVCMKTLIRGGIMYPLDCKHFTPNWDFPDLSSCRYDKK